jgi:hypothetical protein
MDDYRAGENFCKPSSRQQSRERRCGAKILKRGNDCAMTLVFKGLCGGTSKLCKVGVSLYTLRLP